VRDLHGCRSDGREGLGGGPGTYRSGLWECIRGDARAVLPLLPAAVFDACVTDPPYGLGMFAWDDDVPGAGVWRQVMRVLKPGAALVAFAGRRTYHRLAAAVEAAGFRVVDQALWLFRTGRRPSACHLRPAHELILIARAPGRAAPVNVDEARIPYRDAQDRAQVRRVDTLRARGARRGVYAASLEACGRERFTVHPVGREPTTVMATDEGVAGEGSHVFTVPKVRNVLAHPCGKPVELVAHVVKLFVPEGGVVLDPFAGGGPLAAAVEATGRRAVLVEAGGG
jgi:site-specific DNA-methyltransferase (adenine-specific)